MSDQLQSTPWYQALSQAQRVVTVVGPEAGIDAVSAALAWREWISHQFSAENCLVTPEPQIFKKLGFLVHPLSSQKALPLEQTIVLEGDFSLATDPLISRTEGKTTIRFQPPSGVNLSDLQLTALPDNSIDLALVFGVSQPDELGALFTEHQDFWSRVPILSFQGCPTDNAWGTWPIAAWRQGTVCNFSAEIWPTSQWQGLIPDLLLTGLLGGNEHFLSSQSKAIDFYTAGRLLEHGARQDLIIEKLFKEKSASTLQLWSQLLNQFHWDEGTASVWSLCTNRHHSKNFLEDAQALSRDLLRWVTGAQRAILLYQESSSVMAFVYHSEPGAEITKQSLPAAVQLQSTAEGQKIIFPEVSLLEAQNQLRSALLDANKKPTTPEPAPIMAQVPRGDLPFSVH